MPEASQPPEDFIALLKEQLALELQLKALRRRIGAALEAQRKAGN